MGWTSLGGAAHVHCRGYLGLYPHKGYTEPPLYSWNEAYLEGQPLYEVQLTIPARTQAPLWQEWKADSKGKTPWEATQVVAFEVLSQICQ